jgi:hypothetical protein
MISTAPRKGPSTAKGGIGLKAEDATNLEVRLAVAENKRDSLSPVHPAQKHEETDKGDADTQNALVGQRHPLVRECGSPPAVGSTPGQPRAENVFQEIERDSALCKKVVLKMALQRQVFDEPRFLDFTVSPVIGT